MKGCLVICGIAFLGLISEDKQGPGKGKYNDVLAVGDAAPAWADLEGVDGRKHSLSDLKDKAIIVLVFTCNSCPCAVDYEDRLLAFCREYAGPGSQVGVVAICVNNIESDQLPAMKAKAKEKGFPFPYLHDPSQQIAKSYGANYTPEFFVLDAERKVAYLGAMDDRDPPAQPGKMYLEDAVQALLSGKKPTVMETNPRGCKIRYTTKRKPRD